MWRVACLMLVLLAARDLLAGATDCDSLTDAALRQIVNDPDSLKRILQARDAQFDAIEIVAERVARQLANANPLPMYNRKRQSIPGSQDYDLMIPRPIPEPEELTKRFRVRFVIRQGEWTFERDRLPLTGVGGVADEREERLLSTNRDSQGREHTLLEMEGNKPSYSIRHRGLDYDWEFQQLSLGVGLGSRIKKFSAVSVEDGRIHFVATAGMSWWREFVVRGTFDRNLVLRDAVWAAKLDRRLSVSLSVQTAGERVIPNLPCVAQKGTVKCLQYRGEHVSASFADFDSEVIEITSLSDRAYEDKTRFEVPKDSYVIDQTQSESTSERKPNTRAASWRVVFVVAFNLVIIGLLAWWIGRRSRRP